MWYTRRLGPEQHDPPRPLKEKKKESERTRAKERAKEREKKKESERKREKERAQFPNSLSAGALGRETCFET